MNAMIFAAGLGTRLRPLTDHCPKALVPINGQPMLQHVIVRLREAGFDHLIINVHHFAEQIIDFVAKNDFGVRIDISDERAMLLDTGGAIRHAASLFDRDEPLLVHNVDIVSDTNLRTLFDTHCAKEVAATLLVSSRKTSRYLLFDSQNNLQGWQNVKTGEIKSPHPDFLPEMCNSFAFNGIHVISPELIKQTESWPDKFSIIDFYLSAAAKSNILAIPSSPTLHWFDVGKTETLQDAEHWLKGDFNEKD